MIVRRRSVARAILSALALSIVLVIACNAAAEKPLELIKWNEPKPWVERLSAEKYILPTGWQKAIEGVDELVFYNAGGLSHDIATYMNMKRFEQLTGLKVRAIAVPPKIEYAKTLSVLVARDGRVPLLLCPDATKHLSSYAVADWIVPIDFFYPPEVVKLYSRALKENLYIKGHWWAGAETCISYMMFYRPSWLRNAGVDVPRTYVDLYEAAEKCRTWAKQSLGPDYYGIAFGGLEDSLHSYLVCTVRSQGARVWKDGKFHFLDPRVKRAFEYWVNLVRENIASKDCLTFTYFEVGQAFGMGKAAFVPQTITSYVMKFKTEFPAISEDYDVIGPFKWSEESPEEYRSGIVGGNLGMINKASPLNHQAAALLYLDYLRSKEATRNELVVEGNETFYVAQYEDPNICQKVDWDLADRCAEELGLPHPSHVESLPAADAKKELLRYGVGTPMPPGYPELLTEIVSQFGKAALGQVSVEEACEALQELGDQLVE